MIKQLIKIGRLVSSKVTDRYTRGRVTYLGREVPTVLMSIYGLIYRPPKNSMALIFAQNGQASNPISIVDDPNNRTLKDLKEGEVALSNYQTGTYLYFKEDNTAEIVTDKLTIKCGGTTVTIEGGQVTIDAADTTMNGNLQVNGNINATGDMTANGTVTGAGGVTDGTTNVTLGSHTHNNGAVPAPDPGS